jgi:putative transposase
MSDYWRAFAPGGWFFFTVVTHSIQRIFDEGQNIDRLRTMEKPPFQIDVIVILPGHLYTVWRLSDYSLRWRLIKHYLASGVSATTTIQ